MMVMDLGGEKLHRIYIFCILKKKLQAVGTPSDPAAMSVASTRKLFVVFRIVRRYSIFRALALIAAGSDGVPTLLLALFWRFGNNWIVSVNSEEIIKEFGKRVQRCYGCFISYYLKDMYLGEDVTFYCDHCKDETMFHFDEFSKLLDLNKLREVADADHHH